MKLYELYFFLIKNIQKKNISLFEIKHLISFFQKKDNYYFESNLNSEVKNVKSIIKCFKQLKKNIPLPYLINESYFLNCKYFVNKNVLIPRVETEELVLLAIDQIKKIFFSNKKINILDVGTGSGVIAIELKKKFPFSRVFATDISLKALKVAKKNAKKYQTNIIFENTDVFPKEKKINVIVANPPYVKYKKDVQKSVLKYEPHDALFISVKNNVYEKIFQKMNSIKNLSLVILEITENIIPMLDKLMNKFLIYQQYNFSYVKDINQKIRFLNLSLK